MEKRVISDNLLTTFLILHDVCSAKICNEMVKILCIRNHLGFLGVMKQIKKEIVSVSRTQTGLSLLAPFYTTFCFQCTKEGYSVLPFEIHPLSTDFDLENTPIFGKLRITWKDPFLSSTPCN